jgi:hypothetical protein
MNGVGIDKTDLFWAWLNIKDNSKTKTRGNDRLRCLAVVRVTDGELYRCSRDKNHRENHLCIDNNVHVGFDDWACGWELDDEVPHAD